MFIRRKQRKGLQDYTCLEHSLILLSNRTLLLLVEEKQTTTIDNGAVKQRTGFRLFAHLTQLVPGMLQSSREGYKHYIATDDPTRNFSVMVII